ncbi:MAG: hypothetical protein R3208_17105 [Ketobacteraceae bacterium]|nr:hypothetical protein [Ketobacteraceae bacterium]
MRPSLPVMLMAGLLTACDAGVDRTESRATPEARQTPAVSAEEVEVTDEAETVARSQSQDQSATDSSSETDAREEKKKLNLSLPDDLTTPSESQPLKEKPVLPDMFARSEPRTKLGGGVHRDKDNPDLIKSIEGAEVTIEIKTQ